MFDYERYDHTYCRLTKDVEDSGSLKRRFSSASNDGLSDVDLNEQLTNQISVERDNGSSLNREPVIIVRTKKARKTAPAPIIVKAVNKDKGAVFVSTLNTANNSNSIISKNKIVSPVVEQEQAAPEESTECLKEPTKVVNETDNVMPASDGEVSEPVEVPTTIIQTTKSGRPRKLTAKAKQISEESVSKARKSPKVKPNVVKEAGLKRSRGRPKKNVDVNGGPAAAVTSVLTAGSEPVKDLKQDVDDKSEGKNDFDEQSMSIGDSNKDEVKKVKSQQKTTKKASKNESLPTQSPRPRKGARMSVPSAKAIAKWNATVKKSAPSAATKRGPKTKSKLVVVTKPPPKRQAQDEKAAAKASSQSIPAAKIDSSNIVRGSRRRR